MIPRTLEPEVMDDPERSAAYAAADFSESNQAFVDRLLAGCPSPRRVLDIGCGPADIPIRVAQRVKTAGVTGVDASPAMLELGRRAVSAAQMSSRVALIEGRLPNLPVAAGAFDAILCNSVAHHLPDPAALWTEIRRVAAPGAYVHVMDLLRPESEDRAREIVASAAAGEHPLLKEDFYNSLLAAFTLEEVASQLAAAKLSLRAVQASERHWLVSGRLEG